MVSEINLLAGLISGLVAVLSKRGELKYNRALAIPRTRINRVQNGHYIKIRGRAKSKYQKREEETFLKIWRVKEFLPIKSWKLASKAIDKATNSRQGLWKFRGAGFESKEFLIEDGTGEITIDFDNKSVANFWKSVAIADGVVIDDTGILEHLTAKKTIEIDHKLPDYLDSKIEPPSIAKAKQFDFGTQLTSHEFGERRIFEAEIKSGDILEVVGRAVIDKGELKIVGDSSKYSIVAKDNIGSKIRPIEKNLHRLFLISSTVSILSFISLTSLI